MQARFLLPALASSGGGSSCILGPENRTVAVAVERLLLGKAPSRILLVGGPRSGKTTLLRSVASAAEQLGWRPTQARGFRLLEPPTPQQGRLLLLDDADRYLGSAASAWVELQQGLDLCPRVLLTATKAPRLLSAPAGLLDRLREHATLELCDPEPETRYLLLLHFARRHQVPLSHEQARRLAQRWSLPPGELETQLLNLIRGFVPQVQSDPVGALSSTGSKRQQMLRVMRVTARFYKLPLQQLRGDSRRRRVVHARRMAMFLCRRHLGATLEQIGEVFGGKDHTTVLYHYRLFGQLLQRDGQVRCELRELERLLRMAPEKQRAVG